MADRGQAFKPATLTILLGCDSPSVMRPCKIVRGDHAAAGRRSTLAGRKPYTMRVDAANDAVKSCSAPSLPAWLRDKPGTTPESNKRHPRSGNSPGKRSWRHKGAQRCAERDACPLPTPAAALLSPVWHLTLTPHTPDPKEEAGECANCRTCRVTILVTVILTAMATKIPAC